MTGPDGSRPNEGDLFGMSSGPVGHAVRRRRQPAPGQRAPRDHAHPVLLCHREDVCLDGPGDHGVRRLLGDEPAQPVPLGDPLALDDPVGRVSGRGGGGAPNIIAPRQS